MSFPPFSCHCCPHQGHSRFPEQLCSHAELALSPTAVSTDRFSRGTSLFNLCPQGRANAAGGAAALARGNAPVGRGRPSVFPGRGCFEGPVPYSILSSFRLQNAGNLCASKARLAPHRPVFSLLAQSQWIRQHLLWGPAPDTPRLDRCCRTLNCAVLPGPRGACPLASVLCRAFPFFKFCVISATITYLARELKSSRRSVNICQTNE